jgi:hypothetical protein
MPTWFNVAWACFCCERFMSAMFEHITLPRSRRRTYSLAATFIEGAHCGVELFNGQRHGGLQRGGKSSQSA